MRVLFVYPNLYTQMGFNHGLASLSACLLQDGHETALCNLNENLPPVPDFEDVWRRVREWGPGLIGFSCLSQQYAAGRELAWKLRDRARTEGVELPPIVVGGIHPTMVPVDVMNDGVWDHVGVGECEDALRELVRRVEDEAPVDDVPNFLSWRAGRRPALEPGEPVPAERVVHNKVGEFPDLTRLPEPDYELFDTQRILDQKHGWFGLLTSRGCPYRCTYCLNHKIVDRYRAELGRAVSDLDFFRYRPVELVLAEMRRVLETYRGIGTFILDDDLFTHNPAHARAFAEAYEASGIGVPFVVNAHVQRLDPELARALARAGCRILKLGIESGAPAIRKRVLQRHMTDADILETIRVAEEAGLHTSGFLMVGLPGESREDRFTTVDFLARSGLGRFRTSLFFPFPGTEGHRMAWEGGYVREERMASLTDFTVSSCMDFGDEENLLIEKLTRCMPWFVNARLDRHGHAPASDRYRPWVERVLSMPEERWGAFRDEVREVDARLSREAVAAGELHYAIRYNDFMGVRADYFLAEEGEGGEWSTAAAAPVPDALQERALAAAADEVC